MTKTLTLQYADEEGNYSSGVLTGENWEHVAAPLIRQIIKGGGLDKSFSKRFRLFFSEDNATRSRSLSTGLNETLLFRQK